MSTQIQTVSKSQNFGADTPVCPKTSVRCCPLFFVRVFCGHGMPCPYNGTLLFFRFSPTHLQIKKTLPLGKREYGKAGREIENSNADDTISSVASRQLLLTKRSSFYPLTALCVLEPWLRSLQLALTTIAYRDPQGATYTRATCDYPLLMLSNPRFNFKPRLSPLTTLCVLEPAPARHSIK